MKRMASKANLVLGLALASLSLGNNARAESPPNVALTIKGIAPVDGSVTVYDPERPNVVAVIASEGRLVKLQGKPAESAECPPQVSGTCYRLSLPDATFSGTPLKASVTYTVSVGAATGQATAKIPKGTAPVAEPVPPTPPGAGAEATPSATPVPAAPTVPKATEPAPRSPEAAKPAAVPSRSDCGAKTPASPLEKAFAQALGVAGVDEDESCQRLKAEPRSFYDRGPDVAVLLFDEEGSPIDAHPAVDEDDRIVVVVAAYKKGSARIKAVRAVTCDAPKLVRIGGTSLSDSGVREQPEDQQFPQFRVLEASGCSSDTGLKISVTSLDGATETSSTINITTLPLFRLTVGLGLVFDFTRTNEFEAKAVKGESVPVIVKDRHSQGLQPLAMVTFRPVPVDMERVREWWFIPSPTVGVNLAHPLDHVYVGLHLDPWPGLGAVAGLHFMREEKLAGGHGVGDRVPGGDVATDKRWKKFDAGDLFLGVNLDAAIVAKLIGSLSQ